MAAILRSINGIKKLARFLFFTLLFSICTCRKHELRLQNEERKSFELSKFGFLKDGYLRVEVSKMVYKDQQNVLKSSELSRNFGFSLEKTASDGISPYMEQHAEQCILHDVSSFQNHISVAVFIFDLKNKRIVVNKYGSDFDNLRIGTDISFGLELDIDKTFQKEVKKTSGSSKSSNGTQGGNENKKRKENLSTTTTNTSPTAATTTASSPVTTMESITKGPQETSTLTAVQKNSIRHRRSISTYAPKKVVSQNLPLLVEKSNMTTVYSGNFTVMVKDKSEEGLYNLYFHNCANYLGKTQVVVDIHVKIVEKNDENYLSAGEEPLPFLFGIMAVLFFITACYWFYILRRNREYTFKVHYMMFVLVLLKSLDLVFESINYHFIGREGIPSRSWAVMYYITHLLKGALLFTTIVLIGTGYFFVKHVLTDRDKKIFMIVIPLQILANSAQIVMDSTEEAKIQYATWKELFILVDLLCCGAILFPVVWSIRHLQEASKTDGKAAINLAKLKLFRHFYVMIVCYIYFTRIIVYLVKITVPFQYMWFDEFFKNVASYIFFVLTGYKFRPEPDNPYLHVSQEDSDNEVEMDEVVTAQGFMEGISRKNPTLKNRDTSGVAHF